MPSRDSMLQLLSQNLHLLSPGKQLIARWLCDEWGTTGQVAPRWLQRALKGAPDVTPSSLLRPEALLSDLFLELLSLHKGEILRRRRVGAGRDVPLGPRAAEVPVGAKGLP